MPDTEGPEKKDPVKREFMREKIVRQPMTKRQIAKRLAIYACLAVLFGALAAVSFVIAKPLASRYLGTEETTEGPAIMFTRDEPETAAAELPPVDFTVEVEEEQLYSAIGDVLETYSFSAENAGTLYSALREIALQADKGIVTVRSGKQQTDLFGNPVENTGDYAGAVIAKTSGEFLIFTYADAARQADSMTVTFSDGTEVSASVKQIDEVLGMAVISVRAGDLTAEERGQIAVLPLGNSYSVRAGDAVVGVGSPAGAVHSMTYGSVAYVARNVQMTDGITRILYGDLAGNSRTGTFVLNLAGEMIGWVSSAYETEESGALAAVISISDYKPVLERMTNGVSASYFGIKGQEVSEAMTETGMPRGVYVTEVVPGGPAYNVGIQNGDIIVQYGEKEIVTFKELQIQIENSRSGDRVKVKVMRKSRDTYAELEYDVEIGAR